MNCPTCKQPNAPERNFCGSCGRPLAQFCRNCGFRNHAADRFCGGCGASLSPAGGSLSSSADAGSLAGAPTAGGSDDMLAELLEAAREEDGAKPDESALRVSQDDIDSLFEE